MTTDEIGSRAARHGHTPVSNGTENTPSNGGKKPKKKRILLKIFLGLVLLGILGLLAGVGLFWSYAKDAPKLEDDKLSATVSSKLYDANNEVFEELGAEKREMIKPTDVPQLLKDAVVSVEDKRFYKHSGVDPIRILGSAFSNFKTGGLQGGSTLTQQLIKLSYFSTKEKDQNLKRKAQEAWLAMQLEKEKSKEEILTYYINKVYMANGLYGMETAAQAYYGKPLAELSLPQTALLAGMPQAPNDYDPYVKPDVAKERRDVVLYTMKENDKITQKEYDDAKATPIADGLQPLKQSNENRKIVDNYIREVIAEVESMGKNPYTDGLDIHTNLDMNAQKRLYDIINSDTYVEYPDPEFQVASTVIDVKTGQVKAQIGGRNIPDDVQLGSNLAIETDRDVGSTMKPIADYGPAIENLNYSTGRIMMDQPTTYEGTNIEVTNADMQYYGALTMRKAIMYSRNTTAIRTFDAVGSDKSAAFLKDLGIEFKDFVAANAISSNTSELGGNKYGVSSLKLAAAYAAFANMGVYNKPYYVSKVVYQDGSEDVTETESKRAMKDSTAYMMTDMLKDVISGGTAFNAGVPGLIQAGKTGTANYTDDDLVKIGASASSSIAPDSTFVGYTPHYAVSVWTGYKQRLTPIPYEYWGTASDVYREMMTYLSEGVSNDDWVMPDSVIRSGSELYVKGAYEEQLLPSNTGNTSSSSWENPVSSEPGTTSSSTVPSQTEPSSTQPSEPPVSSTQQTEPPASTTPTEVLPSSEPPQESSTPPVIQNNATRRRSSPG
ncbi:1A family penicillin-binding protein [Enterococcus haemoperoxidus ATCC BAA-382]|uniref:1A family penicillin-binding protein n=1 Tax=Enterococcus haemoperoxidus ATCC BAA-382 TaxID=1158608 RepID=R2TF16_9ENTE|nr:PBP1A family penicillin-binding protein [Enterococcus haemoperoxidus]EOH98749.1 1A family penicillin-binding protein [Enterococcus haemoperoxidus ATCC BAA-382]EOT62068.1 penicillin-binding protein 1A [Enterococcus haemoperoxidus ATCC BAA-382]